MASTQAPSNSLKKIPYGFEGIKNRDDLLDNLRGYEEDPDFHNIITKMNRAMFYCKSNQIQKIKNGVKILKVLSDNGIPFASYLYMIYFSKSKDVTILTSEEAEMLATLHYNGYEKGNIYFIYLEYLKCWGAMKYTKALEIADRIIESGVEEIVIPSTIKGSRRGNSPVFHVLKLLEHRDMIAEILTCSCGDSGNRKCSGCGSKYYCSRECQISDWKVHKGQCGLLSNNCETGSFRSIMKRVKKYREEE